MDPKRFYKSADQTKFPKYFQFGTVVEGPTEFYSGAAQCSGCTLLSLMLGVVSACHAHRLACHGEHALPCCMRSSLQSRELEGPRGPHK